MTNQFMKLLSNVKSNIFYVNVVAMPSIDSNNFKPFKVAVLEFMWMNNQSEIETGVR